MKIIFVFIFTTFLLFSCNQYTSFAGSGKLYSESGSLIGLGEWEYTKSKKMDRYDYYQKWENTYFEYHLNGTVKSKYTSVHKRSSYGRPCYEILNHYIEYHENGGKSFEQKDICDCTKSTEITYNLDGDIIERKVIKTKTKEIKKDKKK